MIFISDNANDSQGNFEPVDIVVYSGFSGLFDILVNSLILHGVCTGGWRNDLINRMSEIKETAWFLKRPKAPVMGHPSPWWLRYVQSYSDDTALLT